MKKYILLLIVIIALSVWWAYTHRPADLIILDIPTARKCDEFISKEKETNTSTDKVIFEDNVLPEKEKETEDLEKVLEPGIEEVVIVNSINLDVPFTSQAPTANWKEPFQDACEEASILMVAYYYEDKAMPSAKEIEDVLVGMVDWQIANMTNEHVNLTVSQTADLVKALYNYDVEIIDNLTADKIKNLLRQGKPVIVPANGHLLANPYFTGDGPDYHMLVIKGFVENNFITNDPGTRRGADFIYSEDNLMLSIFDWNNKKGQAVGPKTGLVFDID